MTDQEAKDVVFELLQKATGAETPSGFTIGRATRFPDRIVVGLARRGDGIVAQIELVVKGEQPG